MRTNFPAHAYRREDHNIVLRLGDDEEGTVVVNLTPRAARQLRDEITESMQEDRKWVRAGIGLIVAAVVAIATSIWTETKAIPAGGYMIYSPNLTGVISLTQVLPAGALAWIGTFFISRFRRH